MAFLRPKLIVIACLPDFELRRRQVGDAEIAATLRRASILALASRYGVAGHSGISLWSRKPGAITMTTPETEQAPQTAPRPGKPDGRSGIGSGTDVAAGLFLILCGVLGAWLGQDLKVGTAYRMGPGYAPMLLSWILGGFGLVLVVLGILRSGARLEAWSVRRLVLVLGSMVVFGLTVERLGLLVAASLAVAIAAFAGQQTRWREIALLAISLAAFACLLFAWALQLPLEVLP
jgi:putative tricarboxylic transport membrane protein